MESHDAGREASGGAESTSRRDDEALLKDEDSFVMIDDDEEEDEDMAPIQPNPVLKTPEDAVAYWNQSYEKVR